MSRPPARFAVIRFPGSNCDQDCVLAINTLPDARAEIVWHKDESLDGFDAVVLPGGFSYGDYLRCGAIARFSPIMRAVAAFAAEGKLVIGICNGFQILCESGLLPGALVRNRGLHFICDRVHLRAENCDTPFSSRLEPGGTLVLPIAHGEGCYYADEETLAGLEAEGRVVLRYSSRSGEAGDAANPNGSKNNIAGIVNRGRNVFGLMPHPERACHADLGRQDGKLIFESMVSHILV